MYYPYLRARQFELIALRELVKESDHNNLVTPIIEPVRKSLTSLNKANEVFLENNFSPYLTVNPFCGDEAGDKDFFLEYMKNLEQCSFLHAFHYNNNSDYISKNIQHYSLCNVMLICMEGFIDDPLLRKLSQNEAITKIVVMDPRKYRSLDNYLKNLNKTYIRLDDVFEKQIRNADYLDISAHKLTEEHLYFKEENYNGFSDFTVLPSVFTEGGVTPRAVVIHLSYISKENNSEIWIRHFTSETDGDSSSNVQGKFEEAAKKALNFCSKNNINNTAITELREYFDNEKYPGLGIVKKISIKNHLNVVSNYLFNKYEKNM